MCTTFTTQSIRSSKRNVVCECSESKDFQQFSILIPDCYPRKSVKTKENTLSGKFYELDTPRGFLFYAYNFWEIGKLCVKTL